MTLASFQRSLALLLLVAAMLASPAPARAGTLWYNGDYNNVDSLTNESNVPIHVGATYAIQTSLVYDSFTVPTGQTWTVTSVFSTDQMSYVAAATMATWSIRTGVTGGSGGGGTVVASGDSSATQVAVAEVAGNYYAAQPYLVTATISAVTLTAGTYWLAVAPDDITAGSGYYGDTSYIETTSGANSVGIGDTGQSYITNTYPTSGTGSYNFTPATTALAGDGDGTHIDFSMGVGGSSFFVVPEPSSVALVAVGLFGSLAWAKRRRTALAR